MQEVKVVNLGNNTYHIIIPSVGCSGKCTMCNYGHADNITINDIEHIRTKITQEISNLDEAASRIIILSSYGSMFDNREISNDVLRGLLKVVKDVGLGRLIIETHYSTVNGYKLRIVRDIMNDIPVDIEMGLESSNPYVLQHCINKKINLQDLRNTIDILHEYGFGVEINVLYGAPFLSLQERETDTINSIQWAIDNSADEVVIFPVNIKPGTLVEKLYKQGDYSLVKHSEFIGMLSKIPYRLLDKISISHYGERAYSDIRLEYGWIPPVVDILSEDELMQWYLEFKFDLDAKTRQDMIKSITAIK